MKIRAISFGGGQQSVALLVLAARKVIDFPLFLFANVGEKSEHPATLRYLREHAMPYAAEHGIELVERHWVGQRGDRAGEHRDLYDDLLREDSKSIQIPVHMTGGGPSNRQCTERYKILVIARELAARGATESSPATVGIGISLDEIERANNRKRIPHERVVYPLLDMGLRRTDCQRIIRSAGLPIPRKSACWFCPMKKPSEWQDMRRDEPVLFAKACDLEAQLIARRTTLRDRNGNLRDAAYLTSLGKPLAQAIPDGVDVLPLDDSDGSCDSGWCMT